MADQEVTTKMKCTQKFPAVQRCAMCVAGTAHGVGVPKFNVKSGIQNAINTIFHTDKTTAAAHEGSARPGLSLASSMSTTTPDATMGRATIHLSSL